MPPRPVDRWLARLSWSFLIVGVVLFWRGYERDRATVGVDAGIILSYVGAVVCAVLAGFGARARHRVSREWRSRRT